MPRLPLAFEGFLAGGAFALADALACGLPGETLLPFWLAASGLVLGLFGAGAGGLLARPGAGTATVVALAHGLQWCAIVSKEWTGATGHGRLIELWLLAAASAFLAALLAFLLVRATLRLGAILLAPVLVPASSLAESLFPDRSWQSLAAAFGPALVLGVALLLARAAPRRGALAPAALLVLLLAAAFVPGVVAARVAPTALLPRPAASADPEAPHFLLVIVDTLRADAVRGGSMTPGRPETPALDRLAAEGVEFTEAVSSAPWTLPAHGSLLTGRVPADHGAVEPGCRIDPELPTLARLLHDGGYATAAFTGGGFVVPESGLAAGFEHFDARAELFEHALVRHVPLVMRVARNRYARLWPVVNGVSRSGGLARVAARVGRWLERRDRARPFLIVAHTYQVHDYYLYQADWDAPAAPLPDARPGFGGRFAGRLHVDPSEIAAPETGAAEVDAFRRIYDRRVALVDAALGELVDRVRAHLDERRLVVVVTSDHGEGFDWEQRRLVHGGRLHDDLLRVPLVVSAPGLLPRGRTVATQVSLVDVMPTLLELAGVPAPDALEGLPLSEFVRGDVTMRPAWAEAGGAAERQVALRTPAWKAIRSGERRDAFDLAADPRERTSVPEAAPRALFEQIEAFLLAHPLAPAAPADYDAATREQLRRLGYVR